MAKMIGIDLGTAYTRVVMRGRGTVLSQPTVVATDASGKEILAVGNDAAQMTGKTDEMCIRDSCWFGDEFGNVGCCIGTK